MVYNITVKKRKEVRKMKNAIIVILSVCLVISVIFSIVAVRTPEEMVVRNGTIYEVEDEGEGRYRYEIETEDGNLWVVYGDGLEQKGDRLAIVFYTFNSTDVTEWDILNFWVVGH
jgi:hypothetical protein